MYSSFNKSIIFRTFLGCIFGLLIATSANAATYYVDGSAANDSGDGSSANPKKYIQSGINLMSTNGGDSLIIAPGTYTGSNNALNAFNNGKAGAYNIIKAQTDGTVTVSAPFAVNGNYIQIEGLKISNNSEKNITGDHVKVMRSAFTGGPNSGNQVKLDITATNVLLEDAWFYGSGGRYNLLVWRSQNVVLRRIVSRRDGGWGLTVAASEYEPNANIISYESQNVEIQNCLTFDDINDAHSSSERLGTVGFNGHETGSLANNQNHMRGCIIANNVGTGIFMDGNGIIKTSSITHTIATGNRGNGGNNNVKADVTMDHLELTNNGGDGFADYEPANLTISDSVINNNGGVGLRTVTGVNNNVSGAGPTIDKRIGVSGTLYGEPGYNTVTGDDLWPFPNEDQIKADLCSVTSRGLCSTSNSLTEYLWNLIGRAPPSGPSVEKPINVTIKKL